MLKDITFGQYFESNSFIHKLDPRTKLILLVLLIVFLFVAGNMVSLCAAAVFAFLIIAVSRVPLKMYLKNIRAIWLIITFTAVINLFYATGGRQIFKLWRLTVTTGSVERAVFMALRIVILILISSVLTYATTPNDLTDAIENIFSPLKYLGLGGAVHTIAMMMTIALRFIPTLVEETEKIMNAQKARGADLENGRLKDKIKALVPILIPLLISSVRRAYELAEAMECRCYNGGKGRSRLKQLKFTARDLSACAVSVVFCAAIIILNRFF